jgi:hypothetical protein
LQQGIADARLELGPGNASAHVKKEPIESVAHAPTEGSERFDLGGAALKATAAGAVGRGFHIRPRPITFDAEDPIGRCQL